MTKCSDAVQMGCLSSDTEILTIQGWKKHSDIKNGDIIFSLDINKQKIEQDTISDLFISNYCGQMLNLKANGIDILMTPNCCMVTANVKAYDNKNIIKYSLRTAEEIENKQNQIIAVSSIYENNGVLYSDDFIKLYAWIITEGSMREGNKKYWSDRKVVLYQRMSSINNILGVLERLSIRYSVYERNHKCSILCDGRKINPRENLGHIYIKQPISRNLYDFFNGEKRIPKELRKMNKKQFDVFIKTMIQGDGHIYNYSTTSCGYISSDKSLIDDLQMLLVLNGYKSYFIKRKNGTYYIGICEKTNVRLFYQGGKHWSKSQYRGVIWHTRTKNKTLIIRRNGTVCIVGNAVFCKYTSNPKIINTVSI